MYACFSRFQWSPQLRTFEPTGNWIDGLAGYHIADRKRHLNEIGRRQYAVELVSRERVWISYRSKEGRYRYRTKTDIKDRAKIAARFYTLIFAERFPNKPATVTVQQYELDARIIREKMARLRTLRLAQPQLPTESKPKRKKWPDTQATTRRESLSRSPSLPTLPRPHVKFAKKIFGQSLICAERRFSAI
jgi:hypothetical protein